MHESWCRRKFLKTGVVSTAAAMTAGRLGIWSPSEAFAETYPDLVVAEGNDAGAITKAAVEGLGGMSRFVKEGSRVVIKPNMSFARTPEQASNTHPEVVREVADMCVKAGAARVSIIDNVLHAPNECLATSGIADSCKVLPKTMVKPVNVKRLFREVDVPQGQEFKKMDVVSEVLDSDVLIAVPVGKSHGSAGVSLSMKGMMGLIWDRGSFHGRYNLHNAIVDMVTVLKPQLIVCDATRILSTGGPGGPGKVIPLNAVIASTDMVAADAQMVAMGTWYGRKFTPKQVRHIRISAERGLGRIDLDGLNIRKVKL